MAESKGKGKAKGGHYEDGGPLIMAELETAVYHIRNARTVFKQLAVAGGVMRATQEMAARWMIEVEGAIGKTEPPLQDYLIHQADAVWQQMLAGLKELAPLCDKPDLNAFRARLAEESEVPL